LCSNRKRRAALPCGCHPFPETVTYGADEHEALEMAKKAIRLVLEDSAARGEAVPGDGRRAFAR
jgi:predicted RNase H-like HicB family nuclease